MQVEMITCAVSGANNAGHKKNKRGIKCKIHRDYSGW